MNLLKQKFSGEQIISSILKGEEDKVLSYLYNEVLPQVKKYVKRNSGSEDEAKDVFQDAVIIFYRKVKKGELRQDANVVSYIFVIAKNLWITQAKKNNKNNFISDHPEVSNGENLLDEIITEEKSIIIGKLLSELGENCQRLLKYSIYDNFSIKEICMIAGHSNENVTKTYLQRCKKRLTNIVTSNESLIKLLKNE